MKSLGKALAIFDYINSFLAWLAAILIVFIWFSVCFEVFMRYFLNKPTIWSSEVTEYGLVWITFLGAAWLLNREGHVKIDFLVLRLNPKAQVIINSTGSILCAIVCLTVAYYASQVVYDQLQRGLVTQTLLALPLGPLYIVVPLALFLLFIQFVRRTSGYLAGWRTLQAADTGSTTKL